MPFRFLTAGESHGQALVAIVEGLPAGVPFPSSFIEDELRLRRSGFGRSHRMTLEDDAIQILSGIKNGKTLGFPITLLLPNNAAKNLDTLPRLSAPRPGHADLVGTLKFKHDDVRNSLERASARETAIRTAVGALCQAFLKEFDIEFSSHVTQIGPIPMSIKTESKIKKLIQKCQNEGETLGGVFEIHVKGLPIGLGNFSQWDLKLDGRLAQAVMSIPAIKGVEFGLGFYGASLLGSQAQDEIFYNKKQKKNFGYVRKTLHSGGLEAGVTTGQDLILRAAMKPLSTLTQKPLKTVNMFTKEKTQALVQRTDTCAVPAAAIVAKNVAAIELTKAFLEKFGGDSLEEIKKNYSA
ncbi:MAG: chorismate synthase [Deltaproteobacteria bacterium]|nr:chorismate synthase [Deltaproteobacteria bacterium]MBI3017383.1 chorismate synthase [Deltaproteobacteria bacterium]